MLKGKSMIHVDQTDCCTFILHGVTFYTTIICIVITTRTSNPNTSYQLLCRWIFKFYVHVTLHRNKFLFNETNRRTNFPNLFLSRKSTCFVQFLCPSSGVFHCTFGTGICHPALMTAFKHDQDGTAVTFWSCLKAVIKPAWHMPVMNVQWKTPDDGQRNCPKHVKFLDKHKFGK